MATASVSGRQAVSALSCPSRSGAQHRNICRLPHGFPAPAICRPHVPSPSKATSSPSAQRRNSFALAAKKSAAPAEASDTKGTGGNKSGASTVSSGIKLENIAITFKNQEVLKDISWDVKKGERVGLVGVNGAGKTTQLQIITGHLQPDAGEVVKAKPNMKISYLTQEFDVEPTRTVREEFAAAFDEVIEVQSRLEEVQKELEGVGSDMDRMALLLDELEVLSGKAVDLDVKLLDKKIDKMMPALGFTPDDNDQLVASYSGGWQMRMCLGKLLLQDPDLLLLDEPTNHLDLDAIEWLEGYLRKQEVPMVIVSHDREFLDQLCTKVVETERGVSATFKGNYTQYVRAKEERLAQQWAAWEKQQKEIARQTELVQRLSGGAQSGRASAAEKALEKIGEEDLVEKPFVPKRRHFEFPPVERMGKVAVAVKNLTHGYQDKALFQGANLQICRGERVALIGPNGCGKSTLLKLIMGLEQPIAGVAELGDHGVAANYFEQNQAEALDPDMTCLQTLERANPDAKLADIKALLGRMMFSGKAMEKKAGVLSGGEKARLAMAKFMLSAGSLLVLDEPTNHLDIPSKEMLEEALRSFGGAVVAVSHDRYFLRRIATRVVTVENQKLKDYEGSYDLFLEKNEVEAEKMEAKAAKQKAVEQTQIKAKSKMSKAEKAKLKKEKSKQFNQASTSPKKVAKNLKRWN